MHNVCKVNLWPGAKLKLLTGLHAAVHVATLKPNMKR